jgi:membrane protease YdiL (CAAX protease family)
VSAIAKSRELEPAILLDDSGCEPVRTGYWWQSRRPLTSLAFVLPLLVVYELGVLALGPSANRNGADVWLRQFLDLVGLPHYFLLPVLTVGLLLVWHHLNRDPWRVSMTVLQGMLVESILLAFALIGIANLQGSLVQTIALHEVTPTLSLRESSAAQFFGRLVGFFGAGIYEEVLFRLAMLPTLQAVLKHLGATPVRAALGAILLTSLIFSAAHYVGAYGDAFGWYSFLFRFVAGGFFAVLFVYRGFGIAAGTHALYDILVGMF